VVEAFLARRADPALGMGVCVRRAERRAHDRHALGSKVRVEGRWELRVAIVVAAATRRRAARPGRALAALGLTADFE
jgi:hypothetical protein